MFSSFPTLDLSGAVSGAGELFTKMGLPLIVIIGSLAFFDYAVSIVLSKLKK